MPRGAANPPPSDGRDLLGKDHIFLLERLFYFLESEQQVGLLIMDQVERDSDRKFLKRLHDYFTITVNGRGRTRWIIPTPFFVSSDTSLPVQVADVVIYATNWGYRYSPEMNAPSRSEIADRYGAKMRQLKWRGDGYDGSRTFQTHGIVCVPDLFVDRT